MDKHNRIAIFLPNLDGGGAERTMLNLANGIAERGCNVDLVLAQKNGPYLKSVSKSVRLIDLGKGQIHSRFKTVRRLPALVKYLKNEKPSAILSALTEANVVSITASKLARYSGKVLVNEQNTLSQKTGDDARGLQRWYPFFARKLYPHAFRVIGVSRGVVDDLVHNIGIDEKNTLVVNNPGITQQVRMNAEESIDHPWFSIDQPPVLLSVGRLHIQKDYANLLHAFSIIRRTQHARLIILGEGDERQSLENLAVQLGISDDVYMPGFVDNPHAYMSRSDVYVLSSRWEGLPTVLVEALYCGTKLVSTDCPSGAREILKDGKLGILVPVQNAEALAHGIQRALNGEIPQTDSTAWIQYDLEAIVDQYLDLFFKQ